MNDSSNWRWRDPTRPVDVSEPGKRAAGRAAAELVRDGMRLGLGTGSTVAYFLDALASRGLDIAGLPTSEATAARCRELGIRLLDPSGIHDLDLDVDGADQVDDDLNLTKGGGGALLREKVVAAASDRMVVIVTPDKLVRHLGETFPLPVEVAPFARWYVQAALTDRGFEVEVRDGGEYRTDNANLILDASKPGGIQTPAATEAALARMPGVAEVGLFIDLADDVIVGHDDGSVQRLL